MQNNFSKNLKVLREASCMKLKEIYEQTGITRETIRDYEKGRTYPTLCNLVKLAGLFGVSLDEIVFYELELKFA